MINGDLVHDGGIRSQINSMIKKRISDAKKGTIKVRGNYQTVNIDPIMLCQHMFGQPIQGLLKENEIFNRFWVDLNVKEVVALRAPMVSYNNVKIVDVVTSDELEKWYKFPLPEKQVIADFDDGNGCIQCTGGAYDQC